MPRDVCPQNGDVRGWIIFCAIRVYIYIFIYIYITDVCDRHAQSDSFLKHYKYFKQSAQNLLL